MSHYGRDRHYSLNLNQGQLEHKIHVYAHADLVQKYSLGLQEIFVPMKKILFFCQDPLCMENVGKIMLRSLSRPIR